MNVQIFYIIMCGNQNAIFEIKLSLMAELNKLFQKYKD